jgi:cyclic pyranopterin phosphate synthase
LDLGERDAQDLAQWAACRFLSCSVLPVRYACNCTCSFCFSKSSLSTLRRERTDVRSIPVEQYYSWARERGANRLVVTGGGEPLLRLDDVVYLVETGRRWFAEITCFTNGSLLTQEAARRLREAGLSYLCYSRHHQDDDRCRELMGKQAPALRAFFQATNGIKVRATCVMAKGYVDSQESVWRYIAALTPFGVTEFTFKHTYVAYATSLFAGSREDRWAAEHQIDFDPFAGQGTILATLPWGPAVRRVGALQVCFYREPTPTWERRNGLCRSCNLFSDGTVYASLEDQSSRLFRLQSSNARSVPAR